MRELFDKIYGGSKKMLTKQIVGTVLALVVVFVAVLVSFLLKKDQVNAQLGGILPFGGTIENVEYCCDGSTLLTLGPPTPGLYIYSPEVTRLYEYYDVLTSGPWVLGNAEPGGFCDLVSADCEGGVPGETMTMVGTSAL